MKHPSKVWINWTGSEEVGKAVRATLQPDDIEYVEVTPMDNLNEYIDAALGRIDEFAHAFNGKHDRDSLNHEWVRGAIAMELKTFYELGYQNGFVDSEDHCCANEDRDFNGGCRNCGDPSF